MALTKEQLKKRPKSLGGSDVPAVVGCSPYKTAEDVWSDKVKGRKPSDPRLEDYAEWGELIEPAIREWYRRHHVPDGGYIVVPKDSIAHPEVKWATSTPDGLVEFPVAVGEPARSRGLEIKNRGKDDKARWTDHVPCDVAAQAYWGMYVTGLAEWDCVGLTNGNTPFVHTLVWDEDLIHNMVVVASHLWAAVQSKTEPEMGWVAGEVDFIRDTLVNESDEAAFRKAAYWRKRDGK